MRIVPHNNCMTAQKRQKPKSRRTLSNDEMRAADALKKIWQRKKKALGFKTQEDLADKAPDGWNQSTVSNHMRGEHPIGLTAVQVYARLLKIEDPMEIAPDSVRKTLKGVGDAIGGAVGSDEFLKIPLSYDDKVSGGPGAVHDLNGSYNVKSIVFHSSFADSRNIPHGSLKACRVSGDSMADIIRDGDVVVGRTDRLSKIKNDTIYWLHYDGVEHIKRVFIDKKTNIITINSDNPIRGDGFPKVITPENTGDLTLIAEIFHRAGYVV